MRKQKILQVTTISIFITISIIFFFYLTPDDLITFIGIENAYILMFTLAFLGGLTTFTGIPYQFVLITLAAGGLNPFLIGACSACGVMCGDSTSYYVGRQSNQIIPKKIVKILNSIQHIAEEHPKFLPLFLFLYGALSPFSNDFIVISMGISKYPFWRMMIPLGIGNLVFNITLAYSATTITSLL